MSTTNEETAPGAATPETALSTANGSTTSAYPLHGPSSTGTSISVYPVVSGPEIDISVIHDGADGYAAVNLSAHGTPGAGVDLSRDEVYELMGYLSAAAAMLAEHAAPGEGVSQGHPAAGETPEPAAGIPADFPVDAPVPYELVE